MSTTAPLRTLRDSMLAVKIPDDFDYALANFLDRFQKSPSLEILKDNPPLLASVLNDDGLADAYVASTAAHLCQLHNLSFPDWVHEKTRIFSYPWFAAKSPNLKAILLQESPAAFRVRNLFVSANALSRA